MKPSRAFDKLQGTLGIWRERLGGLADEDFARAPFDGGWSLGQLCGHLGDASDLLLDGAERCARGQGERRGFQLVPAVLSCFGSFPPCRFEIPPLPPGWEAMATPDSLSKEQALEMLDGMERRTRELLELVEAAPADCRTRHPVAGWMNAAQWYQVAEMHLRHHLRQLGRIQRGLPASR